MQALGLRDGQVPCWVGFPMTHLGVLALSVRVGAPLWPRGPAPMPGSRRVTRLCPCFPREPNKTHLVTFFQTDLSGYLPQSVVDSFFPRSMAGFYTNLEKAVKTLYD